jgi:NADPH:quinone reductase-like Zn-dependent oxidoreductase
VLVQGTGGVSIFALQIAKRLGCRVIATSSSDDKLERLALSSVPTNSSTTASRPSGAGLRPSAPAAASGWWWRSAGRQRHAVRARPAHRRHDRMIGVLTGISRRSAARRVFQRNAIMAGVTVGSHAQQRAMVEAIEAWRLEPVIDRSYPLAELAAAFRYQESQQHFGKIVVDLS